MAKAYICDVCGRRAAPETFDSAPKGWFTIYKSGDILGSQHTCSGGCLVAYATKDGPQLLPAEQERAQLGPVEQVNNG